MGQMALPGKRMDLSAWQEQKHSARFEENRLVLDTGLSYDEWADVGALLAHIEGAVNWWVGDWACYGEAAYGEKYAQAVGVSELTGLSVETVRQCQWVSEKVVNRLTSLSWTHHLKVAALGSDEQIYWLDLAKVEEWSVHRLTTEIRQAKARDKKRKVIDNFNGQIPSDIVCGDALAATWPDGIDLVCTDPPYGLTDGSASGVRDGKGLWDEMDYTTLHDFNRAWINKARQHLAPEASLLVCGSLHNTYSLGHLIREAGGYIIRSIVWHKPFVQRAVNLGSLVPSHETILWARFGPRHTCNLYEVTRDVWEVQPSAPHGHPTEKPETLMRRLIEMASNPGNLVVDPFCGSGTVPAVALSLGRKVWACEQDPTWHQVTVARCSTIEATL